MWRDVDFWREKVLEQREKAAKDRLVDIRKGAGGALKFEDVLSARQTTQNTDRIRRQASSSQEERTREDARGASVGASSTASPAAIRGGPKLDR